MIFGCLLDFCGSVLPLPPVVAHFRLQEQATRIHNSYRLDKASSPSWLPGRRGWSCRYTAGGAAGTGYGCTRCFMYNNEKDQKRFASCVWLSLRVLPAPVSCGGVSCYLPHGLGCQESGCVLGVLGGQSVAPQVGRVLVVGGLGADTVAGGVG